MSTLSAPLPPITESNRLSSSRWTTAAFACTMFTSAMLMFTVEPMAAKMMLPLLGGTPAVWNACLVFYQAVLLAGYLYSHYCCRRLPLRVQAAAHLVLIAAPLFVPGLLPLRIGGDSLTWASNPTAATIAALFRTVALPFFALSCTTSLMQMWFGRLGHRQSGDPYFLYAASNAGSMIGLLAYPLALEPLLPVRQQTWMWTCLYVLFVCMMGAIALLVFTRSARESTFSQEITSAAASPISWKTRALWIVLSFVPSSLMLGVNSALTADLPAIPLFWVMPLAVYLGSFILVFARTRLVSHAWIVQRVPFVILCGMFAAVSQTRFSISVSLLVHLAVLFVVAMFCHGELVENKPDASRLTEFYVWISVGGVLGGMFNSLLAPVLFKSVLEFPLVLILAAFLRRPAAGDSQRSRSAARKDILLPLVLGLCMVAVIVALAHFGVQAGQVETTLVFGYSMLWCLSFGKRRLRFALGLIAILLASSIYAPYGRLLCARRSYFGVYRVVDSPDQKLRLLFHGGIAHGVQSRQADHSRDPLSYYSNSGPAGAIFRAAHGSASNGNWAVVGLGAGALSCYAQPGQRLAFYEIDQTVAKIAADPRYFTYLRDCAPQAQMIFGDARLKLREAPAAAYDLIVLDAFSGDSIPAHLLTSEALALYMSKLAPNGMIAFHVSNIYFDLAPTLQRLAQAHGLACAVGADTMVTPEQTAAGKQGSMWVVMARDPGTLNAVRDQTRGSFQWQTAPAPLRGSVWTDDYSNLLGAMRSFLAMH